MLDYYLVGIGGTLMSGLARLLKQSGARVSGCDQRLYPPVDALLRAAHIQWEMAPNPTALPAAKAYVIGNVMRRGHPLIEHLMHQRAPLISAPALIRQLIAPQRTMITIAGTHGKTSVTALVAHVLQTAGMAPGWLIAGAPQTPSTPAHLGDDGPFVIEADEYDTAFFDKRPKFLHYAPDIALINNLEFDHADIYRDLDAIIQQFHYYVRQLRPQGTLVYPAADASVARVVAMGAWCRQHAFSTAPPADCAQRPGTAYAHNLAAAWAVCATLGVDAPTFAAAAATFVGVHKRLELLGTPAGVRVIEDFAHHPTAVAMTLATLRAATPQGAQLLAVLDLRSNSMRGGHFAAQLPTAVKDADHIWWWGPQAERHAMAGTVGATAANIDALAEAVATKARPGDTVVLMSNGNLDGLPARLTATLEVAATRAPLTRAEPDDQR